MQPSANEIVFVDRVGDFFERMGQSQIAGKLFGHLLICDPPEQTAAQLQKTVMASAGSVNSMLRLLQASGFVERRSESGSRKLWYWIAPGAFSRVLTKRMQLVSELKELAESGLAEIDLTRNKKRGTRLREMRDCYAFFDLEFPALVERYNSGPGG
jgi:DNA-binding transcriptional regulator GbsR (MarR family)